MPASILNNRQRENLGEKSADLANITLAALVLGQLISKDPFDIGKFILGIAIAAVLYFVSTAAMASPKQ